MRKISLSIFLLAAVAADAQVFWTEDFGTGCSQGTLASGFVSSNGTWSVTNTGTNGTLSNFWYVSATEAGMGVGNCGDGCLNSSVLNNRTLHVGSNPNLIGDVGAAYFAGPGGANSDVRAETPFINCTGRSNISLSFSYLMEGDAGNDFAALAYFDGSIWMHYNGAMWIAAFVPLALTSNSACMPQGKWTAYVVNLPLSATNNPNTKIAFRWINNNDGVGTDPSFAVDDIRFSGAIIPSCSVSISVSQSILCNGDCNGELTANAVGTPTFTYQWNVGPPVPFPTFSNLCAGTYTVTVTDGAACVSTASITLSEPTLLIVSALPIGPLCNGDSTGSICLVSSGGTPGYNYLWSSGDSTSCIFSLYTGSYSVIVSDANNCSTTVSVTITEPPLLILGNLTLTNPSCIGCTDGSICIGTSSGGTPSYTYSITPASAPTGNCYLNLSAGVYMVCITDANGCTSCTTDTLVDQPSGIRNLFSEKDIVIYPNPFSDEATIEIYDLQFTIYDFSLFDITGREVIKSQITNQISQIVKGDLIDGIYFIELSSNENQILWRGKVVIQ